MRDRRSPAVWTLFAFLRAPARATLVLVVLYGDRVWAQVDAPEKDVPSCFCSPADPPKRPVPDYDGRGPPPATLGDGLIWVPRTLLLPAYLVTEYGLRVPIGAADTYA